MGRTSKVRIRDVLDDRESGIRPGAAVVGLFALGLGGMIVWNAFFGSHQPRSAQDLLADLPPGATTRVEVTPPGKEVRTITIRYDAQVEKVQRELLAMGHYRGLVDGVIGKQTIDAVRKFQSENQLPVTGEISQDLLDRIRYVRKVQAAAEFTGSIAPAGTVRPKAKATSEPGLASVRDVQKRLKKLGYDVGQITGEIDEGTRAAILKFQMDFGLAMDGTISKELTSALKVAQATQGQ